VDADASNGVLTRRLLGASASGGYPIGMVAGALQGVDVLPGGRWDGTPAFEGYDNVVVDLPPLSEGFERLALGAQLDAVVVVAAWGASTTEQLEELVSVLRIHEVPVIGVILMRAESLATRTLRWTRR
jgi:hypothetical protein